MFAEVLGAMPIFSNFGIWVDEISVKFSGEGCSDPLPIPWSIRARYVRFSSLTTQWHTSQLLLPCSLEREINKHLSYILKYDPWIDNT